MPTEDNTDVSTVKMIHETLLMQKEYFKTGETLDVEFRLEQLKKLKSALYENESKIQEVIYNDMKKPYFELFTTELSYVYSEINFAIKKLKKWIKGEKLKTPLPNYKAKTRLIPEPYGNVLIIGPWNFPLMLSINPFIGAISAGNCVVLKPSEVAVHTSKFLTKLINDTFDSRYVSAIHGGIDISQALINESWDYIFFTGSTRVGKIVYQAAAKNLTPVTLELGGKSPVIVDKRTSISKTAEAIVFGKYFNVGQSCVAPDFLYVHTEIKEQLLDAIEKRLKKHYGDLTKPNEHLARIINEDHFKRLKTYFDHGKIVIGGYTDQKELYISPTILVDIDQTKMVMQEEIYGPVLPVLEYSNVGQVINYLQNHDKPLTMYLFSNDKDFVKTVIKYSSSGSVVVNDAIVQFVDKNFPFGGVGASGIGSYHGYKTFETFSHFKGVMFRSRFINFSKFIRDPPYTEFKLKLAKLLLK
ncbi:MAG: Aldehyde dehydrogenase [Candidatus Heimdallarchaeota archaeon LC_3]|nr:MAG: Aldehyde dehydrogenase [Candidatus Heimdallarchaeota archaeon LC_3]